MNIDKYKKEDGYYDEDGRYYEDAESFYQTKVFEFCGCGRPEDNLEYIMKGLSYIDREHPEGMSYEQSCEWVKKWIEDGIPLFGNEESRYFFFYWADKEGLTEHGGSVPGWLTDYGREVLDDLREIIKGRSPEGEG